MKVLHIGVCGIALASLVGCSAMGLGTKRVDYRAGAVQVPSLEVPPDLTAPETDGRYKVAGAEGESVATYSAYSKGESAVEPRRAAASAVLPVIKGVSLEHGGTQRWLQVQDTAENVWPVLKSFLHETGLSIHSEDEAAGIIVTDWAENRAKIPQGGLRSVIGKVFDNLYSSDERDQYRIRLERSKDNLGTAIYITHSGMKEVLDANQSSSRWVPRPRDPEMEAELLQRLMVRFGGNPKQAAADVADGQAASVAGAASMLQIFDGSSVILINDAFDKSWRRVGLAIERAGLIVEDKDRAKGVYFLGSVKTEKSWVDKLEFWKDEGDANLRYRVSVKDGGASCEVSVTDQNGVSNDASRQRLEAIYKNINQ